MAPVIPSELNQVNQSYQDRASASFLDQNQEIEAAVRNWKNSIIKGDYATCD
jgi:hypothetical protein